MNGGKYPHGNPVGVLIGDLVIDVEKVAVTLAHAAFAQAPEGFGKIEIDSQPAPAHAPPLVAHPLRRPRSDVPGAEVAEGRIHPLLR